MFPSQPDVMQDFTAPPVPSAGFYIEFVIFHDKNILDLPQIPKQAFEKSMCS
jgi:hypothetical protein